MFKQYSILALATSVAIGSLSIIASPANAHGVSTGYISGAVQFPETRATQVRHTISLSIPTTDITQIRIIAPEGIKVGNNITLYNATKGQSFVGVVRSNLGRDIEIDLPQPLAANTQISINLNSVSLWGLSKTYQVYSKLASSSSYIYIGSAEFHHY